MFCPAAISSIETLAIKRKALYIDNSSKKIYTQQIGTRKDVSRYLSSGNCKFKQWDTTTHPLEWLEYRTLTTPNADEDVDQQDPHLSLMGVQDSTATSEDSWTVSNRTKHTLTIWSSKGDDQWWLHKILQKNTYSSFIHNCQSLEATKMFFSRWMDE